MIKFSKIEVGRGAGYLFFETIAIIFSGYVFWFIMPKITTSDAIGVAAAVVSVATIFISISTISVPVGVQRFLGKSFADHKIEDVKDELKIKIKIKGDITPAQQALIDSVLASMEGQTGEVEIEINNEKGKTKIKIEQETGKSGEEVELELEIELGITEEGREDALEEINETNEDLKELLEEAEEE